MAVEAPIASMVIMPTTEASVSGENSSNPFANLTSLEIHPSMSEGFVGERQRPANPLSSFEVFNPRSEDAGDRFVSPLFFQDILRSPEINPLEDEQQIHTNALIRTELPELRTPQTPKSKALSQMIGTYMYLYMKPVDKQIKSLKKELNPFENEPQRQENMLFQTDLSELHPQPTANPEALSQMIGTYMYLYMRPINEQTKSLQTELPSEHLIEEQQINMTPSQEILYQATLSDMEIAVKIRDLSVELGADEETATQNTLKTVDAVFQERYFDPYLLQEEAVSKSFNLVEAPVTPENITVLEVSEANSEHEEQQMDMKPSHESLFQATLSDMEAAVKMRNLPVEQEVNEQKAIQNTLGIVNSASQEKQVDPQKSGEEAVKEIPAIVEAQATRENMPNVTIVFDNTKNREKIVEKAEEMEERYYIEDTNANEMRKSIVVSIAKKVMDKEQIISGQLIAKEMPGTATKEMKCDLAEEAQINDGSYTGFIHSLAKVGELQTIADTSMKVDKAVENNTAVQTSSEKQGEVTMQEVMKVFIE